MSAPRRAMWLTTRSIDRSLPGISRDENTTTSSGVSETCRWSSIAMRDSADIGSPWLPVTRQTTSSGGWFLTSESRMARPSGMFR